MATKKKKTQEESSFFGILLKAGSDFIKSELKNEARRVARKQVRKVLDTAYDAGKEKILESARRREEEKLLLEKQKTNFESKQLISGMKVSQTSFEALQRKIMTESFKTLIGASNKPVVISVIKLPQDETQKTYIKVIASAEILGSIESREEVIEVLSSYEETLELSYLWSEFSKLQTTKINWESV